MGERDFTRIKIFYCYDPKDKALRDELHKHLAPLKYSSGIALHLNREIPAGTVWKTEMDTRLDKADIILLLVSSDFFSSGSSYTREAQQALERHRAGKVLVIPILFRPVEW